MTEIVLDASVLLKWFVNRRERGRDEALTLRGEYERGELAVVVPSLLFLELINVAGRRWGWDEGALDELAGALEDLGFDVREPELRAVAAWVSRGLTAYDAAYVALAEQVGIRLVSDDSEVLAAAEGIARPLILPA